MLKTKEAEVLSADDPTLPGPGPDRDIPTLKEGWRVYSGADILT